LLLSGLLPEAEFVSVEVQEVSYALLQRNIVLNDLAHRVRGVRCDLRELALEQKFDLVTGTPPFMPLGSGVLPKDEQRAAGRFELRGGIEAYLETAKEHLAPEGSVSILMDGAQDRRCREAFERLRLHLHQVWVFDPRPGRPSRYRCYIGGLKPSPGPVSEHHLLIREDDGSYSAAMVALRQQVGVEV